MRSKQLNIRLNDEECVRVERLAKHYDLSAPNVVRLLLKEKERELDARPAWLARWN